MKKPFYQMSRQEYEEHFKLVKQSHESELRDLNKHLDYFGFTAAGAIAGFFTDYLIFGALEVWKIVTHDFLLETLPYGIVLGALFSIISIVRSREWQDQRGT